jgi:hypothetical protein
MQSCFPSRDMVSPFDPFIYPMGEGEALIPPLGLSSLEFPFESILVVCRSSRFHSCDSSLIDSTILVQNLHSHMEYGQFSSPFGTINPPRSHDFSDFELPSDEAILESITIVSIPWEDLHLWLCFLPFWETFQVDY